MVYSDKIDIQNFIKENDTLCGNQGSKQDKKKKKTTTISAKILSLGDNVSWRISRSLLFPVF